MLRWVRDHADRHCPRPEPDGSACVVELDELCGTSSKKGRDKLWVWQALARDGRLIDWECGGRDRATLDRLLKRLGGWGVRLYCTDEDGPYAAALPAGRHHVGKDATVRRERHNARRRHWFARFRRRTVVGSRSAAMVDHTTLYRWVQRFAPELEQRLRRHLRPCRGRSSRGGRAGRPSGSRDPSPGSRFPRP